MSPRLAALAGGILLVAVLGGTLGYTLFARGPSDRFETCRSSRIAGGADQIGGPFTLLDAEGATVTDADVITKPTLLYFGYTFCPDVCPLDTMRNAEAVEQLAARGIDAQGVFVSVDPGRDTPEVVGAFAENFSDRMVGLTGTPEQVQAASRAYRTYYRLGEDAAENPYYLVDHSTFTYLVLPGAGFVELFRRDDTADDIATRTACFVDRQ